MCDVDATQEDVFEQAVPLVNAALEGANATIFAYGQTGSGKTHTMIGTDSTPGVVPRAVEHLWRAIADAGDSVEYQVYLTYVELYNDGWRDLLATSSQPGQKMLPAEAAAVRKQQAQIQLREITGGRGRPPTSYLEGSDTFRTPVGSLDQLRELIAFGSRARAVGTTTLNERSSRSHAVITLNVHSTPKGSTVLRTGKLNLVDLAGSEALTTDTQSVQTVETRAINKSLTSLCDVLQALSKNSRRPHGAPVQPVPYRNHKLTRLLADSLGGNSHTLMIAAVQRSHTHFRSTLTTLKYASRARDITQHAASVNEVASGTAADAADAAALRAKVAQLEARLSRREEEIERLESLQSARDKMATREHERQLAEQRASLAEEQGALQLALNELKAQASADAALSEREAALRSCEHEYEISGLEIRMLERMMDNRAQLLEAHLSQHELNAAHSRAEAAEAARALAAAQRDEAVEQSRTDSAALEAAAAAWRADRAQLDEARARLEATAAAETEMETIRALLVVLDEADDADADDAGALAEADDSAKLLWLKTKLREGLKRVPLPKGAHVAAAGAAGTSGGPSGHMRRKGKSSAAVAESADAARAAAASRTNKRAKSEAAPLTVGSAAADALHALHAQHLASSASSASSALSSKEKPAQEEVAIAEQMADPVAVTEEGMAVMQDDVPDAAQVEEMVEAAQDEGLPQQQGEEEEEEEEEAPPSAAAAPTAEPAAVPRTAVLNSDEEDARARRMESAAPKPIIDKARPEKRERSERQPPAKEAPKEKRGKAPPKESKAGREEQEIVGAEEAAESVAAGTEPTPVRRNTRKPGVVPPPAAEEEAARAAKAQAARDGVVEEHVRKPSRRQGGKGRKGRASVAAADDDNTPHAPTPPPPDLEVAMSVGRVTRQSSAAMCSITRGSLTPRLSLADAPSRASMLHSSSKPMLPAVETVEDEENEEPLANRTKRSRPKKPAKAAAQKQADAAAEEEDDGKRGERGEVIIAPPPIAQKKPRGGRKPKAPPATSYPVLDENAFPDAVDGPMAREEDDAELMRALDVVDDDERVRVKEPSKEPSGSRSGRGGQRAAKATASKRAKAAAESDDDDEEENRAAQQPRQPKPEGTKKKKLFNPKKAQPNFLLTIADIPL